MKEVLLVGNPNSGKTTLFNSLTKSSEHVGNWHGVTVEEKKKMFKVENEDYLLVDTPGIYSLSPLSFEEEVSFKIIESDNYSKIINLCDLNNLQRNLYLTLCLLEENKDVVVVINEIDKKAKYKVNTKKLSNFLSVPVFVLNAEDKEATKNLKQTLKQKDLKKFKSEYLDQIDFSCLKDAFKEIPLEERKKFCVKAFERNENFFKLNGFDDKKIKNLFSVLPQNSMELIASARYNFLDLIIEECCEKNDFVYGKSKFDKILLNKFFAFPCFLLILSAIFYLTFFSLGAFLSNLLSSFLNLITTPILDALLSIDSPFIYHLFADALFGGVATVLSFLPQVVLLFFFLSVLEDSGYLSRVAFIFEDILGKIGLSGKSVYTLLMGFGCSTTAIMTARNMDNKNSKIKTAILCPYMSCSAKIPIYTVIGGAFFGASNIFVIIGLYLLGVVVALVISKILDMTLLKSENQTFILEFPPYRMTSFKRVGKILWKNVKSFLIKVGSVMISMNVIVFLLSSFTFSFNYTENGSGSMLESIGKFLAPIFEPIGFNNWAIVSALLAGLVAKEVVVSSIAMFNGVDGNATSLISSSILLPTSVVYFASGANILSFLVFCLLYTPCLASISMMLQEIGKKWTIIAICIELFVAYIVSFIVYNIALAFEIFDFWTVFLILLSIVILLVSFVFIYKFIKRKKCPYQCENCSKVCKRK